MENNKPSNPSAFPSDVFNEDEGERFEHEGMSLRDYFAAKAMQVFLAEKLKRGMHENLESYKVNIAPNAYDVADAMLKQRELLPNHN